jgi:hypothetical protein
VNDDDMSLKVKKSNATPDVRVVGISKSAYRSANMTANGLEAIEFQFDQDVDVLNANANKMNKVVFKDTIHLRLIVYLEDQDGIKKPRIDFGLYFKNDRHSVDKFKSESEYQKFIRSVINFETSDFFDITSSARLLVGLVRSFNEYSTEYSSSAHVFMQENTEALKFAANCQEKSIDAIKKSTLKSDDLVIRVG